jgi:hypothetical protein
MAAWTSWPRFALPGVVFLGAARKRWVRRNGLRHGLAGVTKAPTARLLTRLRRVARGVCLAEAGTAVRSRQQFHRDHRHGLFHIQAGKGDEKSRPAIQQQKFQAAKRTIDLYPATVAALRSHKDQQAFYHKRAVTWQDNDLLFCTGTGGVLNSNNILRNFVEFVERVDVPGTGVHDLRHTHAMLLLLDGVPLMPVSKRLGHAKLSFTVDSYSYSYVLRGFQHLAVGCTGAALFGSRWAKRSLPGCLVVLIAALGPAIASRRRWLARVASAIRRISPIAAHDVRR